MPNLVRLIVLPTKGDNSNAQPPNDVAALAQALNNAEPRSQLDLQDPYFNSAAMHQSFKQKVEVVDPGTPLLGSLVVEPPHMLAHEVDPIDPNVWTQSYGGGGGGGVVYGIDGTTWYVGIHFQ